MTINYDTTGFTPNQTSNLVKVRDMLQAEYESWCNNELRTIPQWTKSFLSTYIVLCAVNGLFALTSFINNSLVLIAITKTSALHKPSYMLLFLLAASDLGVGCIVLPLYILKQVLLIQDNYHTSYCSVALFYLAFSFFFTVLSFHAILAISTDRHLAVYLQNRYTVTVTKKRVKIVVFCIIAVTAVALLVFLHLGTRAKPTANAAVAVVLLFYLIIATLNFVRINRVLKKQRMAVRAHPSAISSQSLSRAPNCANTNAVGNKKYTKAMQSMSYVFGAVVLCYTPVMIMWAVNSFMGSDTYIHLGVHITGTIVYANSSVNPILYYWRIPDIREAVGKLLQIRRNRRIDVAASNSRK